MTQKHDAPEGGAALYLVTDFDRLEGGMFGKQEDASAKAAQLAEQFPGNTVHVLATYETHRAGRALARTPTRPAPVDLVDAVRPEVYAFALLMERELRTNDHKPGWKHDEPDALASRVVEEAAELRSLFSRDTDTQDVPRAPRWSVHRHQVAAEAADVANMAMMVADVCGCLDATLSGQPPAPVGLVDAVRPGAELTITLAALATGFTRCRFDLAPGLTFDQACTALRRAVSALVSEIESGLSCPFSRKRKDKAPIVSKGEMNDLRRLTTADLVSNGRPLTEEERAIVRRAAEIVVVAKKWTPPVDFAATLSGQQGGAVPAGDLWTKYVGLRTAYGSAEDYLGREIQRCRTVSAIEAIDTLSMTKAREALDAFVRARLAEQPAPAGTGAFALGDRVEKIKGSSWRGPIVGTYSTSLTPRGYAVESEREPGSVQIYPEAALRAAPAGTGDADRVEGLRKAARDVLAIWDDTSDGPGVINGDKRMAALRAALDGASGQGEGR